MNKDKTICHLHSLVPYKKRRLFKITFKDDFNGLFMGKLTHLKAMVSGVKM